MMSQDFKRSSKLKTNSLALVISAYQKYLSTVYEHQSKNVIVLHARPDGGFIEIKQNLRRKERKH